MLIAKKNPKVALLRNPKEFLQMELKLKPEEDFFAQAKIFLNRTNPEMMAAVSDSPQKLNSLSNGLAFLNLEFILLKTYNKEPTKFFLQKGYTRTPELIASHLAFYMKNRHIVIYCAIEDPGRIHKLFCDNLSKLAHLIKGKISPEPEEATKQIDLWADIIFKYFEI